MKLLEKFSYSLSELKGFLIANKFASSKYNDQIKKTAFGEGRTRDRCISYSYKYNGLKPLAYESITSVSKLAVYIIC